MKKSRNSFCPNIQNLENHIKILGTKDPERYTDCENMQNLFHNIKKHVSHSFSDLCGKTIAIFELKPD